MLKIFQWLVSSNNSLHHFSSVTSMGSLTREIRLHNCAASQLLSVVEFVSQGGAMDPQFLDQESELCFYQSHNQGLR